MSGPAALIPPRAAGLFPAARAIASKDPRHPQQNLVFSDLVFLMFAI